MDISKIDKNFLQKSEFCEEDTELYDIAKPPFALYGVAFDEKQDCFTRMPDEVAKRVSEGVRELCRWTAGGRVRFATDSKFLTLIVRYEGLMGMPHMAFTGSSGFALCENGEEEIFLSSLAPMGKDQKGFVRRIALPEGKREYTLYFPLYNDVKQVYIGLDKGSKIERGKPYEEILPVVYYGSSITQGGCASRPDTAYQGFICKRNNVDFINLGFSGNAKAEEVMIDYLAGLECSALVFDYDYNAPDAEYLRATHYKAYTQYRAKRPTTPIVFVSKPDTPRAKDTQERAKIVRETYEKAKAAGDKNVYYIDGRTLLEKEWQNATVDGCHPTDFGFYQMSLKIGQVLDEILKIKK